MKSRMVVAAIALLAFASGGVSYAQTATPFPIATTPQKEIGGSTAFDGTNYLVGMTGDSVSHANATAQLVSLSGSKVGSLLSTGRTAGKALVAFDGTNYLLVWDDTVDAVDMNQKTIYGQFVSTSGTNVGSMFQISNGATVKNIDAIVFDGTNYLVIWTDDRKTLPNDPETTPGAYDVYGQLVSKSATLVGANFKISGTAGKNGAVAFDGTNYLVIWNEDIYDTDVNGKLISKSGTAASSEFVVNANSYYSDNYPLPITFDGTNYLVVWPDEVGGYGSGEWDLFGQFVTLSGLLSGGVINISAASGQQSFPGIAFDGTNYMVTWTDMKNDANHNVTCDSGEGTCWDIYGQYINKSGSLVGSEFVINDDAGNQLGGVVGFNSGKYFVIVNTGIAPGTNGSFLDGGDVYGVFLGTAVPSYTLTVNKMGSGSGTVASSPSGINCGTDCTEDYTSGTVVTLTANPDVGSFFAGWSGACTGTGACIVAMDANKSVTATFNLKITVTLVPDSRSIPRGGTLGYTVTVTNNTSSSQTFKYWTYVKLPNGSRYPTTGELFGPVTVTLSPWQVRSAHLTHGIPNSAPLGTYTYYGNVGPYPTVWDSDSFTFTVTSTASPGTRREWELLENNLTK